MVYFVADVGSPGDALSPKAVLSADSLFFKVPDIEVAAHPAILQIPGDVGRGLALHCEQIGVADAFQADVLLRWLAAFVGVIFVVGRARRAIRCFTRTCVGRRLWFHTS